MKKAALFTLLASALACSSPEYTNWDTYLGDLQSTQYSELTEIDVDNVKDLSLAWSYNGGGANPEGRSQIQCNPIVHNGVVYATTAVLKLVALNGESGEKIWEFNPFEEEFANFGMGVNRGLMIHSNHSTTSIIYSAGRYVYAIDTRTGKINTDYFSGGILDLQKDLSERGALWVLANTPGVIFDNLLIIGGRVSESTGAAPGHIRAFDLTTGEQEWIFHTIPKPGEEGYETWPEDAYTRIGGVNVWTGMALDEENEMVFCPTGSAAFDFYGGDRHGDNLFANSLIALNARTGERIWHFQTIHHDIWDKDLPTPPNLVTLVHDGEEIPAVAQATKNGFLYVFNRLTGEPLHPIKEIEVPASELKGELASITQPVPSGFPQFSRTELSEQDLAERSEEAKIYAQGIWETSRHEAGAFEPPSEEGTIIFPGFDGGGEWGGAAYDPTTSDLIINSNELPWRASMVEVKPATVGERTYMGQCQSCHGDQFQGSQLFGNVPSLKGLDDRLDLSQFESLLQTGKGIMPPFAHLDSASRIALYNYINGRDTTEATSNDDWPYPYIFRSYEKLYAPDGYPIIKPPWGQLTSIDLNERKINWQVPLGEHEELSESGMPITGTENYGGPVVTAGGLVFIASTMDEKIRAFNKVTGEKLWEYSLPAAGYATPAVYAINGSQYLVIACGGGKLGTKSGDFYLAFSLKE